MVNGCQSLTCLYENKKDITKELRIVTKFINVPPNDPLAAKITDHTNNQNGTTFRDLQSNNPVQVRLQSEIHREYKGEAFFRIKRGEHPEWPTDKVIENDLIARVLLAFDQQEPYSCHQSYRLFDEFHTRLFGGPHMNADRIIFVNELYTIVKGLLGSMANQLFGNYTLTRYLIVYLLREALETDDVGRELCKNPSSFLSQKNGRTKLREALAKVAAPVVRVLDTEATRRSKADADGFFDYKNELKSPEKVRAIRAIVISQYQVLIDNKYSPSFGDAWNGSSAAAKAK